MGHGSHISADSSAPVYQHAAALRALGFFDEVLEAFWKEEPSLPHALDLVTAEEIWIVPIFLAEGYFTRQVIPRELGLTGPIARPRARTIHYCDPVGTHPLMAEMVMRRAFVASGLSAVERSAATLLIIGHGTERSATSGDTVYRLVDQLQEGGEFGDVRCGFLDEEPNIGSVLDAVESDLVVLVPFFIAEGWHTATTIPKDLKLDGPVTRRGSRTIWYTPPVGTLPDIAQVILALTGAQQLAWGEGAAPPTLTSAPPASRVAPFGYSEGKHPVGGHLEEREHQSGTHADRSDREAFFQWVDSTPSGRVFLEAHICRVGADQYELRHVEDAGLPQTNLGSSTDLQRALEIARYTEGGEYRPLRTAATLRRGWLLTLTQDAAWRAMSLFYPATVVYWNRPELAEAVSRPYQEWAARQTGIYGTVRQLTPELLPAVVEACCVGARCQRTRLWRYDGVLTPGEFAARGGSNHVVSTPFVPCPEPCTLFASIARETLYAATTCELSEDAAP